MKNSQKFCQFKNLENFTIKKIYYFKKIDMYKKSFKKLTKKFNKIC